MSLILATRLALKRLDLFLRIIAGSNAHNQAGNIYVFLVSRSRRMFQFLRAMPRGRGDTAKPISKKWLKVDRLNWHQLRDPSEGSGPIVDRKSTTVCRNLSVNAA